MAIKVVLFDMDGVLTNTKDWHYEALNLALKENGFSHISKDEHLSKYDGLPTKDKLEKHPQTKMLSDDERNAVNKLKQKYVFKVIDNNCKPNPVILKTVEYLKNKNIRMACCSNSIRDSVISILEKSGILKYMEFIISNEDVLYSKPNPEMYLKAIEKMGVSTTEVLICEDNIRGITAALHSGAFVLEIGTVEDTNIDNISKAIEQIEEQELSEQLIRPAIRTALVSEMIKGWFVGDFYPSIMKSILFEAGVKEYKKGDKEPKHLHKIGTEITVVVRGKVIMCDRIVKEGEMILMEPGVATSFEALEDTITFVVKSPSSIGDKYQVE